jgi:hypothetical protein
MAHGGIVESQAFLEKWGGIDNDVGLWDEGFGEVEGDVLGVAFEINGGVQFPETAQDGVDARLADLVGGLQQLAIEVSALKDAAVSENEAADARSGEFEGDETSEAADAGDQHGGGFEAALTVLAHAGHPHLPLVAGMVCGGQWW